MSILFSLLTNPVTISVLVLCVLCLTGLNVLLSMLIACIIGGVAGGIPLLNAPEGTQTVMQLLTGGFASNATTALAYILLGTFATCIATTGLADILSKKLSRLLGGHKLALIGVLTLVACLSQNLIPVHIAYIPILVPPLLDMMNRMRLDRRAVACALAFGHKAPYITIPFGFGLIFQRVIADNLSENGLSVTVKDVTAANWSIGVAMLIGLFIAVFVLYRKPRDYHDIEADTSAAEVISEKLEYRHYVMLAAAIVVAVVQVISQDLALSALCGLIIIIVFRAIKWSDIDEQIEGGIRLMGQIAIIMLVAGGYASVIKATGGIDALVNAGISAVGGSKVVAAIVITLIGLLVTMGIGTSFGTVPVLAVLFVPMCSSLGFSTLATRCMFGEKLKDMGCGTGLHPESDHYAVKVPVFSFQKLRDLDTQLGPEMKSTGEVLGVAKTFREALLKGLTGAGFQMKKKGAVLISVRDSDKQEAIRIGERFEALGFDIYATSGTANVLNRHMVATNAIRNVDEPSPNIIDLIESGKIDYVVATSVKGRHPELGSVHIRRTAVERAIPCLTSMDTVSALLRCLEGDIKIENCEMVDINTI